jgi:hypothetical protein
MEKVKWGWYKRRINMRADELHPEAFATKYEAFATEI